MTADTTARDSTSGLAGMEQCYRELFELASDGVFILDVTDDGRFRVVSFNPAEERLVGIPSAAAAGKFIDELLPAEVAESIQQNYRRCVKSGQPVSYTEDLAVPSGRRLFSTTLVPLKDERGVCRRLLGVARNVTEEVAAVDAVRESEQRFRVAFQTIPDSVALVREDGVIIAVNEGFCRQTGWSEAEAVGATAKTLRILPDPGVVKRLGELLARDGIVRNFELRIRAKSGAELICLVSSQSFTASGKSCRLTVTTDITERRREERAQAAVYQIAEAAGTVQTLHDLLASVHRIIGEQMPAENFYIALLRPGTQVIDFAYLVDQQDADKQPRNVGRGLTGYVLRTGEPLLLNGEKEYDELVRRGDVERIGPASLSWLGVPLKTQDRTVGVLVAQSYTEGVYYGEREKELLRFVSTQVARAIERKLAEETLRASEHRFRALIENSTDGTLIASVQGDVIFEASVARLLGHTQLGRMVEYVHPDDLADFGRKWQDVLANPGLPVTIVERVRHLDGSWRVLEGICVNLVADPAVRGVVVNFRDVTERKQIEAQLLAADRMVSLGTLAAGVAHEVNNPLTYVIANLTLAVEALASVPGASAAESVSALREAQQGAERVRQIIRGLKTFSRTDDAPPGPVDVHQVIDASINMAWNEIRHRARLVKDYGRDLPPAHGNEARLGQVFLNLLVNASQAIEPGDAEHNEIRVTTSAAEGRLIVAVKDTGAGVPPENMARLFDPFFTTKPIGVGTGLGLFICQGITRALGGDLTVESQVGRGSVFRVILPVAREEQLAAAPATAPAQLPPVQGRILAIDDEPLVGRVLKRALAAHQVVSLTSAAEALARIRAGEMFDLIFCDLMMPHMTGMEFHAALVREAPALAAKVIFLTGGAFTQAAREFLEGSSARTVSKPFDVQSMRALVADLLGPVGEQK